MVTLWLSLLLIGAITFAYRASFIFFVDKLQLPLWLQRALRFVPVAALTALVVPELLVRNNALAVSWQNERFLAGLVAVAVAWWTKNILLTLVLGMAALYGFRWLIGA